MIDLCVRMLNPTEDETIIDPACGSAGFTVHTIFHVWKEILKDDVDSAHAARREARELLERAKRAVEIAIEENEAAALRWLDQRPE